MNDDRLPARVERALAAVLDAPDPRALADKVCRGVAALLDVDRVVLLEIGPGGQQEIARFGDAGEPLAATVLEFPSPGVRTVVAIGAAVPDADLEPARLLVEVAATAAERFAGDDAVREQQARLRSLVDGIRGLETSLAERPDAHGARASEFASAAALLTGREREILENILEGASNTDIAEKYTLSVETVKTHVKHILRKMAATNRAELISRSQ
ncbi:MAG TPA: LuxR C-terminal-related transcriptional regulator [Aldersonia sp.]